MGFDKTHKCSFAFQAGSLQPPSSEVKDALEAELEEIFNRQENEAIPANPGDKAPTPAALKMKLRRLCELKKGGRLQVPTWLHEAWKKGDHLAMATQYQKANFDKDRTG